MKNNFLKVVAGLIVLLSTNIQPVALALDIPVSVTPREYTADYRADTIFGGHFRSDGSNAWDFCIETGCHLNPQVGDRAKVDFDNGWHLTFWNVGELGGDDKKTATLSHITEFISPGETVTEVLPPLTADSPKSGITFSKVISVPAADIIEPYLDPARTYTLGFTGGPNGVFYESGEPQFTNGRPIRGDVMKGDDGKYFVQMSGAFTANLVIDDPNVFDGFAEAEENTKVVFESDKAYGFSDYGGEVWVESSNGDAFTAVDFDLSTKDGRQISAGMTVKTGSDSYAVIVLSAAGSKIVIGPNSQVKIKAPEQGFFDTQTGRLIMKVKGNVEKMIKDGTMPIVMNQAVAGRKGTIAVFDDSPEKSTIKVLEGQMYLTANSTGDTKDVLPGQSLSADQAGLSEISNFDIESELAEWEKIVPTDVIDEIRQDITTGQSPKQTFSVIWIALIVVVILIILMLAMIVFFIKKNRQKVRS